MSKMSIIMSGRNKPRFLVDDIYYEGIDIPSKELIGKQYVRVFVHTV